MAKKVGEAGKHIVPDPGPDNPHLPKRIMIRATQPDRAQT